MQGQLASMKSAWADRTTGSHPEREKQKRARLTSNSVKCVCVPPHTFWKYLPMTALVCHMCHSYRRWRWWREGRERALLQTPQEPLLVISSQSVLRKGRTCSLQLGSLDRLSGAKMVRFAPAAVSGLQRSHPGLLFLTQTTSSHGESQSVYVLNPFHAKNKWTLIEKSM